MIAHIFDNLCDGCNNCVMACPPHVLDAGNGPPDIARLDQCQTCYMCELYCTSDAIYVVPDAQIAEDVDPEAIRVSGHHGRIPLDHGLDRPGVLNEYRLLGPLLQQGSEIAEPRYRVLKSERL